MADTASPPSTPKKGKAAAKEKKAKKPKATPNHPVVSVMVNAAITNLKERGGSSLQAIKKYISSNYKVDADRLAPFIRKYIKKSVAEGKLVQTKGSGASGSFKMSSDADKSTKKTSVKKVGAKKAAKPKKTPTKKARTPKPKKSPAKKPKAAKPKKSPAKKPKAAAAKKAKSPRKGRK